MGRRHKSTNRNRDTSLGSYEDLENEMLAPRGPSPPVALRPPARSALLDDRRRWDPGDTPRDAYGRNARVSLRPKASPKPSGRAGVTGNRPREYYPRAFLREVESFSNPRTVMICVRRKTRREVLFAKSKTGKGARSRKRYNPWSSIKCGNR